MARFCMIGILSFTINIFIVIQPARAAGTSNQWLLESFNKIQADKEKSRQAYLAGKERARLCGVCHGKDGNSVKKHVPNLAGQNPVYLWKQIDHFASGKRKNFVMQALAKDFTDEDKLNLAIYFSSNKVHSSSPSNPQKLREGKKIYKRKCISCHGISGQGSEDFARIAGQKEDYLKLTLENFRKNANQPGVNGGSRRSAIMESITKDFTDEDIATLAAYITALP